MSVAHIKGNAGEFSVGFSTPTLERFFDRDSLKRDKARHRYKHTIEPALTYRYVTGVNHFANFVHFDSEATLTHTSEREYWITPRPFRKAVDHLPQELDSLRILQKLYIHPHFSRAIFAAQRNVFQSYDC